MTAISNTGPVAYSQQAKPAKGKCARRGAFLAVTGLAAKEFLGVRNTCKTFGIPIGEGLRLFKDCWKVFKNLDPAAYKKTITNKLLKSGGIVAGVAVLGLGLGAIIDSKNNQAQLHE